jgi:hypothetical protein
MRGGSRSGREPAVAPALWCRGTRVMIQVPGSVMRVRWRWSRELDREGS